MASIVVDNENDVTSIDDLMLTADWALVEESLTPIPADVQAGIDRTAGQYVLRGQPLFDLLISPEGIATPGSPALMDHIGTLMRSHNEHVAIRRAENIMATQPFAQTVSQESVEKAIASQRARRCNP